MTTPSRSARFPLLTPEDAENERDRIVLEIMQALNKLFQALPHSLNRRRRVIPWIKDQLDKMLVQEEWERFHDSAAAHRNTCEEADSETNSEGEEEDAKDKIMECVRRLIPELEDWLRLNRPISSSTSAAKDDIAITVLNNALSSLGLEATNTANLLRIFKENSTEAGSSPSMKKADTSTTKPVVTKGKGKKSAKPSKGES